MPGTSRQLSHLWRRSPGQSVPSKIDVEAQSILTTINSRFLNVSLQQLIVNRLPHYKDLSTVIYIWGDNPAESDGADKGRIRSTWKPSVYRQLSDVHITSVSCSSSYLMLLSRCHQLYALGRGEFGQLGLGSKVTYVGEPTLITSLHTVSEVSCGAYHCVALGDNGRVYSWGRSDLAGHPDGVATCRPLEIVIKEGSERCRSVCASDTLTVCACDSGSTLYHWGIGFGGEHIEGPQLFYSFNKERIRQIALGKYFGLALSETGKVFCWGDNTYGETMCWDGVLDAAYSMLPRHMNHKSIRNIARIVAGDRHALMVDNTGRVLSIGENMYGQCGMPPTHHTGPFQIDFPDSSFASDKVACGPRHSACINNGNQLYTWGHSSNHKLIYTTSVDMLVHQQRQPGVSVSSGLMNGCSQPQLIYSLLDKKIACVGLADGYTVVVSGEGVVSSNAPAAAVE